MQHRLLAVIGGAAGALAAAAAAPNAPAGPTACAALKAALGTTMVVSNHLNVHYLKSRFDYFNTLQDLYQPSCIVFPINASDVSVALKAIRAADSHFAIKAGGHNPNTFFSSTDEGVLIDLVRMNRMSYDPDTTLATYEPGSRWGDLYKYYEQFGMTVVGGRLAGVGTGLALGGGLSHLSPQYGLACDSFVELQVVLPGGDVVTASSTTNPDLFFAMRGGGGNAYGVVTQYTVQARPAGQFFGGNIIYAFEPADDRTLEAVHDFALHNTDPKAAIIGSYVNILKGGLESLILFAVYDGPDPGNTFANFTRIPHVMDTTSVCSYVNITDPIRGSEQISKGQNTFRVGVHRLDDDSYKQVFSAWRAWCAQNNGSYLMTSLDFEPIPRSLTDASKAQGGNAMQMPDGPWFWVNYLLRTIPGQSQQEHDALQRSFKAMVDSTPNAPGLPLFINDAHYDQNPLSTFSTYPKLQAIKAKYDPDGFFASRTGGWSFA